MYVHTARTEQLDLASVADEFVSSNTRKMNYFGKFKVTLYVTLASVANEFVSSNTRRMNYFGKFKVTFYVTFHMLSCIQSALCLNQPS